MEALAVRTEARTVVTEARTLRMEARASWRLSYANSSHNTNQYNWAEIIFFWIYIH